MYSYSFSFLILAGTWRPLSIKSKYVKHLYNFYTAIGSTVYYTFMISEILDIFLWAENVQQITENMIQLVNVINASQKHLAYILKRKKIIKFMNMFTGDLGTPNTPTEKSIKEGFDDEYRGNAIKVGIIYSISVFTFVYLPFFITDREDRFLPYRAWRPYSLDNVNNYYIAYLHQAWAVSMAACGNYATETLVSGFMIQICAQFEILEQRFLQMPKILNKMREQGESENKVLISENEMIIRLVHHHWLIYEMADTLNTIFVFVIFFQFFSSISVLCVCTFNLAMMPLNIDFITIFLFTLCMLIQVFLYTWYGNEITLRSTDFGERILRSDWNSLSRRGIRSLMIIYERSTKPIILSSGYVIALSNASFTSIVKTSYSVFNVLSVN